MSQAKIKFVISKLKDIYDVKDIFDTITMYNYDDYFKKKLKENQLYIIIRNNLNNIIFSYTIHKNKKKEYNDEPDDIILILSHSIFFFRKYDFDIRVINLIKNSQPIISNIPNQEANGKCQICFTIAITSIDKICETCQNKICPDCYIEQVLRKTTADMLWKCPFCRSANEITMNEQTLLILENKDKNYSDKYSELLNRIETLEQQRSELRLIIDNVSIIHSKFNNQ
ncbi:MAG: hypothetical protein Edafosvirus23_11 [Edafosvirus sp.]|uniref:RING-type domain-containing protein n=1 Tax=Edafosvirus sp. TaxID=2487765 RepID=A0A3G4ZUT3_9VIRU|nr:MAG: hypothetical protein Edafosvirus23_11 [Edafosvirus sp.]